MARSTKSKKPTGFKEIKCRECGEPMRVADDAVAGECWKCLNYPKQLRWKLQGSFMKGSATG